ncbi:MotE family protein [Salipiger sp.]|uniref:MotE family protein n=1 Tax=Salipiger sp. TaxID=2078585 RepID=UPI003A97D3B1
MMLARKTPKAPRTRRGMGVLAVIGALLIASALARIGMQAGAALALENTEPAPEAVAMQDPTMGAEAETASAGCPVASDIGPILEALKTREERVSKRESDLRARMQALSVAEAEIDRRMSAMEDAERRLRETLAIAKTAAEEDVAQLTQVYATMKPKQAAALFEEMEPDFAAGFLGRMRPDAAAAIMAGLSPQKAYTISVMLAGRNAAAPRE